MPLRPTRVHRFAIHCQENEEPDEEEEEEIDRYDPGDGNPYSSEYIYQHEPFRHIPHAYCPYDGFSPPHLVFGVGLLHHEAVAYAEELGILVPSGSEPEYSGTAMLEPRGYRVMARHFSTMYGHKVEATAVMSRKCDIAFALFDNYSRPEDVETRGTVRDTLQKLVEIFPAALERRGYFYGMTKNDSMYPEWRFTRRRRTSTLALQEREVENDEEIDEYDPGDSDPYTPEYIFKHEPFLYIPLAYDPFDGFSPPRLVFGVGLLHQEAVAHAEELGILVRSESKSVYSVTTQLHGYYAMARHFSKMYGRRIEATLVMSRKCDIALVLFDNHTRPEDVETRGEMRDILKKLVDIFPAALERRGYFFWALNDSMYPEYEE